MYQVLGTCSICGGRVSSGRWGFVGMVSCEQCCAVPALHGPVIPMLPAQPRPAYVPCAPSTTPWNPPPWGGWQTTCAADSGDAS